MTTPTIRMATLADVSGLVELRILMQKEVNSTRTDSANEQFTETVRRYFMENLGESLGPQRYVSAVAQAD